MLIVGLLTHSTKGDMVEQDGKINSMFLGIVAATVKDDDEELKLMMLFGVLGWRTSILLFSLSDNGSEKRPHEAQRNTKSQTGSNRVGD